MSVAGREAAQNYSKGSQASRDSGPARPGRSLGTAVRAILAGVGFAGAILCLIATFSTVIQIKVLTVVKESYSGLDRHSIALVLIGVFAAVMVLGAARGARPAMLALAVCGVAVLLISIVGDLPDVNRTGPIGELYEDAKASPQIGYYLETLAGALLLVAGGGFLLWSPADRRSARSRSSDRAPAAPEPAAD